MRENGAEDALIWRRLSLRRILVFVAPRKKPDALGSLVLTSVAPMDVSG